MAIISLRAYNREIEGMIDSGQLDEAVAHCRHILATFPKHIATYRLLGKAHLEQQRISDATDIFQRVLTAIPEDFISNVGMSIIREDENNLDAAIWHMELAYEAQPANLAIQDELRRLYGRRDGMQPPKVRLTRGALARMYAKGGLYDQAIAELRAAIAEDPNRPDLQLLLAQMFYQTSQRVEAVDTCVNILKKLPQCLEANRILAVSLPEAEGSDAIKNYRQTVVAMDPYFAFAETDAITSDQVAENSVNIERLDWKSGIQVGEASTQPSWANSLGISIEKPAEENVPDWLKSAEAPPPAPIGEKGSAGPSPFIWDTQEVEKIITDTSKPEGEIPDWMKEAGWKPATGEVAPPTEESKPAELNADVPINEDLEKADLPDWLRGIAPEGVLGQEQQQTSPKEEELVNPWLEPKQPGPTDSIIHWLEEEKPVRSENAVTKPEDISLPTDEDMPDWLKDLDITPPSPIKEIDQATPPAAFVSEPPAISEQPVISEAVKVENAITQPGEPSLPLTGEQPASSEDIIPPEVTAPKEPSPEVVDEVPDWLRGIAGEMPSSEAFVVEEKASEGSVTAPSEEEPIIGVTQPLKETSTEEQTPIAEEIQAQEQPVSPEEITEPVQPQAIEVEQVTAIVPAQEGLPSEETVKAPQPVAETEAPLVSEEIPAAEVSAPAESLPIDQEGQMVEKPVVAQEVPESVELTPAELVTSPAEVEATPIPSVLEELAVENVIPPQAEETPTPTVAEELPVENALPPQAEETPIPSVPEELLVEEVIPPLAEEAPPEPVSEGEPEAFAWLENLATEQAGKTDELVAPPAEGEITPPEWVKLEMEPTTEEAPVSEPQAGPQPPTTPAEEIPDWIKGLGAELEPEVAPEVSMESPAEPEIPTAATSEGEVPEGKVPEGEVPQAEELPAWLLEMEQPEPEKETAIPSGEPSEWKGDELPDWLKELAETDETEELGKPVEVAPITEAATEPVESIEMPISEEITSIEAVEEPAKMLEEVPETWVPEVEEAVEPVAAVPIEQTLETPPVTEEITPQAVEITPTAPEVTVVAPVQPTITHEEASLSQAREALNNGQPAQATEFYTDLIKKDFNLEEILKDLKEAVYNYPIDVGIWVTLGDAYLRTNDLQQALDAYIKAEELVR